MRLDQPGAAGDDLLELPARGRPVLLGHECRGEEFGDGRIGCCRRSARSSSTARPDRPCIRGRGPGSPRLGGRAARGAPHATGIVAVARSPRPSAARRGRDRGRPCVGADLGDALSGARPGSVWIAHRPERRRAARGERRRFSRSDSAERELESRSIIAKGCADSMRWGAAARATSTVASRTCGGGRVASCTPRTVPRHPGRRRRTS